MGNLVKLKNGFALKSEYFSKNGPIVMTPGNFKLEGGLKFEPKNIIRYSGKYTSEMVFKNGDLLMVMTDLTPDCNLLGKSGILNTNEEVLHNQRIGKLIVKSKIVDKGFLCYYLNSNHFSMRMKSTATGSTVRHTSVPTINGSKIPLPPTIEEQKAIAGVLSDTDALIVSLDKLIAKKKAIKQGSIQRLLTPKNTWKKTCLVELAENRKSNFDDGDWVESEYIIDKGIIRLLQTGNIGVGNFIEKESKKYISEESFSKLKCKEIVPGDLLVCRLAEPAGRACILPEINEKKIITSVDVSIFRGNKLIVDREFLSQYFTTSNWFNKVLEKVGGTTHKRISRGSLGKVEFYIPSTIEEQKEISSIMSSMDKEINSLEVKKSKYVLIKQGMMQELLTGRTRLI